MCLATCATAACCCAGEACCSCMCLPAKMLGVSNKNYSKLGWVFFQLWWLLIAFAVCYIGTWFVQWTSWIGLECPAQAGGDNACFNASGLVRMSWSLAWLQFAMFLVTLMKNDTAAVLHDGWWTLKSLIVLGLFVGSMWIPNSPVIIGYMKFSRIVSVLFLSFQGMLMLCVAYVINDALVEKASEDGGSSCAGITLMVMFITLTVGNVTWLVF